MSRLLDELEYNQVLLLDAAVHYSQRGLTRGMPLTASDVLYGPSNVEEIDEETEGRIDMDIARLITLGLAKNEIPGLQSGVDGPRSSLDLVPTRLGKTFRAWIMEPAAMAADQ